MIELGWEFWLTLSRCWVFQLPHMLFYGPPGTGKVTHKEQNPIHSYQGTNLGLTLL